MAPHERTCRGAHPTVNKRVLLRARASGGSAAQRGWRLEQLEQSAPIPAPRSAPASLGTEHRRARGPSSGNSRNSLLTNPFTERGRKTPAEGTVGARLCVICFWTPCWATASAAGAVFSSLLRHCCACRRHLRCTGICNAACPHSTSREFALRTHAQASLPCLRTLKTNLERSYFLAFDALCHGPCTYHQN